ncbi:DUF2958 domain-containing protein [Candidatus Bathyarchaeota archaeon]|nr:DUF2958 domain-containing protein [Candidatus Bathyarchaeota archaeon]
MVVAEKPSLGELRALHSEVVPETPRTLSGSGKQPEEHWLPPQLEEELIKEWNRSEDEKTGVALVKYFTPDGSASWYLSEYYPEDDVFYGYCDLGTGFPELGYVSRKELRDNVGKMGLPIERDYYFTPKPLNVLQGNPDQPKMPPVASDLNQLETPNKSEPKKVVNRNHQGPKESLTRPMGAKARTEYYGKAMPYTLIYNLDTVEQITVKEGALHIRGMDPSHIAMIDLEIPNRFGIPDGEYSGEALNWGENNKSLYQTPDKIEWKPIQDGGEIHFTKGDKTIRLALTRGFNDTELPEPRIRFNAKADIELKQLQGLINESQAPHIDIQAYQAEDGRNKLRAWWNEERAGGAVDPVSHGVILNEDLGSLDEESQTTYDKEYLKTLLENLTRGGATTGEIQFSTDMPLQLDTEGSEAVTRFWLAPCIDVGGGGDRYHPEDPRTTVTMGSREKQEWRDMATPYSVFSYIASGGDVDVNVNGRNATLRAMDSEHIGMIEVETTNHLDIPDGKYGGSLGGVSGNMGTYRYPEKLLWDPELNQLIVDKKGNQAVVDLEAGTEYAQLPHITEGDPIGDVNLGVLSQALNDAWKNQKNEYSPSIAFKQQDNEIVLEYADPEGTLHTDTLSLDQSQGALLESTSYNPGKLRDFLRVLGPMNPEHVTIKQNGGNVLTLEAVKGDSVIRYHLAPMIGA